MVMKRMPSFSQRPGFPSGLRVLLLEADAKSRSHTEELLAECSYQVTSCCSTEEALLRLSADASTGPSSFDVLLAEQSMVVVKEGERQHLMEACKGLPCILMADDPTPQEVMQGIELGAVEFLAKPLSPLKLRNIWQHTVRKMMGEMSINCPRSAAGSNKPSRAASVPLPKPKSSSTPVPPAQPSKAASVAALLPWGLVTSNSSDEESSDMEDVMALAADGSAAASGLTRAASVTASCAQTGESGATVVQRGSGNSRAARVHSCPSTRSLQTTDSSRSSSSAAATPGSPSGALTPSTAPPQQQHKCGESSGEEGAGRRVRRAVRQLPQPALGSSRPPLALKPGNTTPAPAAQQVAVPAVPLPTGLGPLPCGMVWGMPMASIARAPGITPPVMPSPMPWGPMAPMCVPTGFPATAPMVGMPMAPMCPPAGFPSSAPFPGMVPCSAAPNGAPAAPVGSSSSSSSSGAKAAATPGSQRPRRGQQKHNTAAAAPAPAAPTTTPFSIAPDASTTAEAVLNAIASLDFEFHADDDDVGDVDELMAQIDIKPDMCELRAAASAPAGASCLALDPEQLAAATQGGQGSSGALQGRAASCLLFDGSPESSEEQLTRCDSASMLPSLESLFGLAGDECSSDLLPPLDAPLGLCLRKTGSLADMVAEGLALQAA